MNQSKSSPPTYVIEELFELRAFYNQNNELNSGRHIKELLNSRGVIIIDKLRIWHCKQTKRYGYVEGPLPVYNKKYNSTNFQLINKIEQLIIKHMQMRYIYNWAEADKIRIKLQQLDIELIPKEKKWKKRNSKLEGSTNLIDWSYI